MTSNTESSMGPFELNDWLYGPIGMNVCYRHHWRGRTGKVCPGCADERDEKRKSLER